MAFLLGLLGLSVSTNMSEQISKTVNNAISETIINLSSSCRASTGIAQRQRNTGTFQGIKNSFNQYANVKINLSCLQNSVTDQDLIDKMTSAIKQAVDQTAKATPTLFNTNVSTNVSKTVNEQINNVVRTISFENVRTCAAQIVLEQDQENPGQFNDIYDSFKQEIRGDMLLQCIQENSLTVKAVSDLATSVEQVAKQEAESGLTPAMMIAILIICCFCCLSCVASSIMSMMGGGDSGEAGGGYESAGGGYESAASGGGALSNIINKLDTALKGAGGSANLAGNMQTTLGAKFV